MKLSAYLELKGTKPSAFATEVGVPASTISRILSGDRVPTLATVQKINEATKGAVTASDFSTVKTVREPRSAQVAA